MKKIKKYLMTSLSLGLAGISVGAIAASCANAAAENNNPDPASQNSITTNPGDPLTQEQIKYNQNLANEIKKQFDANASLDYSNPEDKAKIDSQIAEYENNLNEKNLFFTKLIKNGISELLTKLISLSNENDETDTAAKLKEVKNQIINIFSLCYDDFSQKNLLPTIDQITKIFSNSNASENKSILGITSIFYSDPKSIILLIQCYLIKNKLIDLYSSKNFTLWIAFQSFSDALNIYLNSADKNSPSYKINQYYGEFLNKLDSLLPKNNSTDTDLG